VIRYCRAYPAARLREYGGLSGLDDVETAYLWDDYSVTIRPFVDVAVVSAGEDERWREYCSTVLAFHPSDLSATASG
jgi:hypothetical protein